MSSGVRSITNLYEETDIFGRQYPGRTHYGPNYYSGVQNRCYCCNRKFTGNFWAIVNSPGITYICRETDPSAVGWLGIIPYALIFICPDCSVKEGIKNVLMRCHGCSCICIPDALYKISPDLKIYCECCYSLYPERFYNNGSFTISVYDNTDRDDMEQLHREWLSLEKIPLEKSNPFIKSLLQSH